MSSETKLFSAKSAIYSPTPNLPGDVWSLNSADYTLVDKMSLPTNFQGAVRLCKFYYEHDGLAHTAINKQVEIGINGFGLNQGSCSNKELEVYEYIKPVILSLLERAALEYLLSGLVVPEIVWEDVPGNKITPTRRGKYELPEKLWIRDPLTVDLRKTPIPERVNVMIKLSDDDISFIRSKGVYPDGTKDLETYEILVEQYGNFVKAVTDGQTEFKLVDPLLVRRKSTSGNVWPTPYLTPALELLMHKRNLRKMDYAIAARVIQAIQLFKLGNDEYPLTEDDTETVENLKAQLQWRGLTGNQERVFQLFSNHTLTIEWVTPDVRALLDEGKYRAINDDMMIALGMSRVIVAGENARTGTGDTSVAMLPPMNSIESMRRALLDIAKWVLEQVKERNGFKGVPEPYCPPIRLQSFDTLMDVGKVLYDNGIISGSSWGEMGNFDYETELKKRADEKKLQDKYGIEIRPNIPFSPSPNQNSPDKKDNNPVMEKDNNGEEDTNRD